MSFRAAPLGFLRLSSHARRVFRGSPMTPASSGRDNPIPFAQTDQCLPRPVPRPGAEGMAAFSDHLASESAFDDGIQQPKQIDLIEWLTTHSLFPNAPQRRGALVKLRNFGFHISKAHAMCHILEA